ncbi:MAG: hypothetical protein AB7E55_10000 [Pigmentiphaga sp.]
MVAVECALDRPASINFAAEKTSIEYSPSSTTPQQLIERIQHAGFTVLR